MVPWSHGPIAVQRGMVVFRNLGGVSCCNVRIPAYTEYGLIVPVTSRKALVTLVLGCAILNKQTFNWDHLFYRWGDGTFGTCSKLPTS